MERRAFILRLPVVTGGLALGTLPVVACAGTPWLTPRVSPRGWVVPSSAVPVGGAVFVPAPDGGAPIFLHRPPSGTVQAVLASCTHLGCQPEPVGARLVCPCHGSAFTFAGDVLEGPADRPLRRFEVEESGGEIVVRVEGARP